MRAQAPDLSSVTVSLCRNLAKNKKFCRFNYFEKSIPYHNTLKKEDEKIVV